MDASSAAHQVLLFPPPFLLLYSSCFLPSSLPFPLPPFSCNYRRLASISYQCPVFFSCLFLHVSLPFSVFLPRSALLSLCSLYTILLAFLNLGLCCLFSYSFFPVSSASHSLSQTYMCMDSVVCTHMLS